MERLNERVRGEAGYDDARTIWNAMFDRKPAVIVQCTGAADVILAVNFSRERDLTIAVKGVGHNVTGDAVCDDGLVIDLSPTSSIRVDPEARTVRVGPGAKNLDVQFISEVYIL